MNVQHYPVEPNKLLAGEYPGNLDPRIARDRLASLVRLGVRTFIDLTRPEDGLQAYEEHLKELGKELDLHLRRIAMPVPDMDVPESPQTTRAILDAVREAIDQSPAAYVHCWGGIGRTGTVVGCWLREQGQGSEEALARVQELYSSHMPKSVRIPEAPQTLKQKDYVRSWQPVARPATQHHMSFTLLVPDPTHTKLDDYLAALGDGTLQPGSHLGQILEGRELADLDREELLQALLDTKVPQIFAESAVAGDGSDWNLVELSILGDLSIAVEVTVYDNGRHVVPEVHADPFPGTLVFTPGALLRNGGGQTPADWEEVTESDRLNPEGFQALYERRLLPVFEHINARALAAGRQAMVTVPGLGCGQFAGPFAGELGEALERALEAFLKRNGGRFGHIKAVYYDPYNECSNGRSEIHGIQFMVRPLTKGNGDRPQLCLPTRYQDEGDDFSGCDLFTIVAWDHVSWPGNDFFGGSRCTDDGVKAAATDSMFRLTGLEGIYDPGGNAYRPPYPHRTWAEVVEKGGLRLRIQVAST